MLPGDNYLATAHFTSQVTLLQGENLKDRQIKTSFVGCLVTFHGVSVVSYISFSSLHEERE